MDVNLGTPSPSRQVPDPTVGRETGPIPQRAGWLRSGWTQSSSGTGPVPIASLKSRVASAVLATLIGAGLLWSYWPMLVGMAHRWSLDPRYSHGFLVPPFALYLLWIRRRLKPEHAGPAWGGLVLLAIACLVRFAGVPRLYHVARGDLIPHLARRADRAVRWTGRLAVGVAIGRVPHLHGAAPLQDRGGTGIPAPADGHGGQRLRACRSSACRHSAPAIP